MSTPPSPPGADRTDGACVQIELVVRDTAADPRKAALGLPRTARLTLLFALACSALTVAPARGQTPDAAPVVPARALGMQLVIKERGWVALRVQGTPGRRVAVVERLVDGSEVPVADLALATSTTGRRRILPWRCDRLARTLVATSTAADGSVERVAVTVATPRCTRRIGLDGLDGRAAGGFTIRLVDRWTVGDLAAQLCVAAPGARFRCRSVRFAKETRMLVVRERTRGFGRHRVQIRTAFGQRTSSVVTVRRRSGRFTLLATGDSMIQIIDSFLTQRLRPKRARVISDARISTGVTKPAMLDWVAHARGSARSVKPDVTVMFIGANDGFALKRPDGGLAACCSGPWVDAYARRVEAMMRSYLRSGRGRVYWLLLPTPRGTSFQRVFRGVNAGIEQAAKAFDPSEVRLLDLRKRFTPGGRFRPAHRQGDGVHLSTAGASITAGIIVKALREDGYVR